MAKARHTLSSFEDNLKRYALVTKDNKINIWDTVAGSLRSQCFTPATSKQINQYSTIAWGKSGVKISKGERGGTNDVVVGTVTGAIHIWDLLTSEIALSLGEKGEGHVGAVNDVVFHHHGGSGVTLFSCGADGQVIQWDLRNKNVALKWKSTSAGVSRIAVYTSNERGLVATAESSIKLWDLSSQKLLIKFPSDKITNLRFTPDGESLLSTGSDRLINMWSCTQQSISENKKNALRAFSCDSVPMTLQVTKKKASKNAYMFLAITEGGAINVFDSSILSKGILPAACVARLGAAQQANGSVKENNKSVAQYFVDAHFHDNKDLLVVVGPETSPSFQRIAFANEDGTLIKSVAVEPKQTNTETLVKQTKAKVTTLDSSSIPPPNVIDGKKRRKTEVSIASMDAKKIASIEQIAKDINNDENTHVTFQSALEQAIHTSDSQLLHKCLTISNYEMVKATLLQLAPSFIIPLVKLMITMLQTSSQPQAVYSYLHIIINNHTSLLMSSGALRECAALYSVINARAQSYLDLLKAKGRIDLFLAHLDHAQASVVVDTNAKNVYRETQNVEEDEEGEGEEEEGEGDEEGDEEDDEEVDEGEEGDEEGEDEEAEDFIKLNGKDNDGEEDADKESGDESDESDEDAEEGTSKHKRKRPTNDSQEEGDDDDDEDEDEDDDDE